MGEEEKNNLLDLGNFFKSAYGAITDGYRFVKKNVNARLEVMRRNFNHETAKLALIREGFFSIMNPWLQADEFGDQLCYGPAYRRHPELVAMTSDQKVLIDELAVLGDVICQEILNSWKKLVPPQENPKKFESLSELENQIMNVYLQFPQETKDEKLAELTKRATEFIRVQRNVAR